MLISQIYKCWYRDFSHVLVAYLGMKLPAIEALSIRVTLQLQLPKFSQGWKKRYARPNCGYCGGRGLLTIRKVVVKVDPKFINTIHSILYKVATYLSSFHFLLLQLFLCLQIALNFHRTARLSARPPMAQRKRRNSRELVAQSPDAIVSSDSLLQRASPRTCCTQATKRVLSERVVYFTERPCEALTRFRGRRLPRSFASGDVCERRSRRKPGQGDSLQNTN